jgi:hypothetical protein
MDWIKPADHRGGGNVCFCEHEKISGFQGIRHFYQLRNYYIFDKTLIPLR